MYRGNNHFRPITTRKRFNYEFAIFSKAYSAHASPRLEFTLVGTSVNKADMLGIETAQGLSRSAGVTT